MKHYRPLQPIAAMTFDLDDTLYACDTSDESQRLVSIKA